MMPAVACPVDGCAYVTADAGDAAGAVLLKFHLDTHTTTSQQRKQGKPNKIKTPKLKSGIGPDNFNFWRERWDNYKRVNRLKDVQDIQDQLVNCCETELYRDLHNTFGTSLQTKTEEDLILEMQGLAVPHHRNLGNIIALRSATQERDERIRS